MLLGLLSWPLLEYALHRACHTMKIKVHMDHHVKMTPESSWFTVFVLLACRLYGLALGALIYFSVHWAIHKRPKLVPYLAAHHLAHHRRPDSNFSVVLPFLDTVFGTRSY